MELILYKTKFSTKNLDESKPYIISLVLNKISFSNLLFLGFFHLHDLQDYREKLIIETLSILADYCVFIYLNCKLYNSKGIMSLIANPENKK